MRPLNLNSIEEKTEGGFDRMPAGAYPCTIVGVQDVPMREYLTVLVDVTVGKWAGEFSRPFYADKPWAHSLTFSYKESALGFLKGRLHCISDCNPGFDAEAAINAGREQMLVGKSVGVVFGCEEYLDRTAGEFKVGENPRPQRLCRLAEIDGINEQGVKPAMMSRDRKVKALRDIGIDQVTAEATVDALADGTAASVAAATHDTFDDSAIPF